MAGTIHLTIVTPDATVYSGDADMVTLPGVVGQMGILRDHIPLMTEMVPGEIIVRKEGKDSFLAVGAGVIEVQPDRISILTDLAVAAENIDEAKAEEARQRAAARLREKLSAEEVAAVNASLVRALAQLKVRRRHKV